MAEPVQPSDSALRRDAAGVTGAPLDLAAFPGCWAVRITRSEIDDYEGRLEYWEASTETAMVLCEPVTTWHEQPSQRLARLAERIAASRGSPIETFGCCDLVRFDESGAREALMQADQVVYLHPLTTPVTEEPWVDVDGEARPDVVLEVDYSTDVRRGKLRLYEAWGFPEVWVDVPDARSPSRPKSRPSALTIHLLEDGRFRTASASRAFAGWTAAEIHRALNEQPVSRETLDALRRVGRTLGEAEGTGPDDDPWLAAERGEALASSRAAMVVAFLEARGLPASPGLVDRLAALVGVSDAELVRAANACTSADELLRLLHD